MKKLLLLTVFAFAFQISKANETVVNNYTASFNKAYQLHPEIPKGILEAVSFYNTLFNHIQHASAQSESCMGIPNAYGVMGLTLDGQNYFSNNLVTVSKLSGVSVEDIINDPEKNILAYADAYVAVKNLLYITTNDIASQAPILVYLSELPQKTIGQNYALQTQLYGYLHFLNSFD